MQIISPRIINKTAEKVGDVDPEEIEDLINELEDLSDSGPDVDTISVGSTPKPSLRLDRGQRQGQRQRQRLTAKKQTRKKIRNREREIKGKKTKNRK